MREGTTPQGVNGFDVHVGRQAEGNATRSSSLKVVTLLPVVVACAVGICSGLAIGSALHHGSAENGQPQPAPPQPKTLCPLAKWFNVTYPLANVFNQLVPAFVNQTAFEIVTDASSKEFCEAFANIGAENGPSLFGDHGWTRTGYGGISSYGVLKVREGVDVELYGTRANEHHMLQSPWFCGAESLQPTVNFTVYSNDRVAICWPRTMMIKCRLKAGAVMVVGSGAWRNTIGTGCDTETVEEWGIKEVQVPRPKYLQYVFDHKIASACWSYDLDKTDLWKSLQGNATQFWPAVLRKAVSHAVM